MINIPPAQNWRRIVSRGKYPMLLIYELNQGLLNTHKVTGFKIRLEHYCRFHGASYLYEPEAQQFIAKLVEVLEANPARALSWLGDYRRQHDELLAWVSHLRRNSKLNESSKDDLKKIYFAYEKRIQILWRWGYLPFLIDDAIALALNKILAKLKIKPQQYAEVVRIILSAPPELTLMKKRELELIKLSNEVKKSGFKHCHAKIEKYLGKWGWKNWWIYKQSDFSWLDLIKEIKLLIRYGPNRKLAAIKKEWRSRLEEKEKFFKKRPDKKLRSLACVLAAYNHWHSLKMEEITRIAYLMESFFSRLARFYGLSYQEFIELTPQEVKSEKINRKVLRSRLKNNGILMLKGKVKILNAKEIRQATKAMTRPAKASSTLQGFAVFAGHAQGRAVVVPSGSVNVSKIKIKRGDILVTSMTSTNMAPIVKEAAAVVTDEGGLLCHASIVSRELRKPCVVGTKIATKIFKDGDLVEVDAERGVVRKIK